MALNVKAFFPLEKINFVDEQHSVEFSVNVSDSEIEEKDFLLKRDQEAHERYKHYLFLKKHFDKNKVKKIDII